MSSGTGTPALPRLAIVHTDSKRLIISISNPITSTCSPPDPEKRKRESESATVREPSVKESETWVLTLQGQPPPRTILTNLSESCFPPFIASYPRDIGPYPPSTSMPGHFSSAPPLCSTLRFPTHLLHWPTWTLATYRNMRKLEQGTCNGVRVRSEWVGLQGFTLRTVSLGSLTEWKRGKDEKTSLKREETPES